MTSTAIKCARPGCGGTIDGGYCDTCGLAPEPVAAPVAAAAPGRCARPGCGGTIDGGYCDTCGLAPEPAQAAAPAGPASTGSAPAGTGGAGSGRTGSRPGSISTGSGRTASGPGSRRTRAGSGPSRGHLGAGLVEIPPVPPRDPASAVLANPLVAENKRFCGACDRPVGRGKDGQPGLVEGYCPYCGTPFSFAPRLEAGELVAGQYEVLGCLAHGGLGWIYLAIDHNLGNRWVVLKGLLNTGDAAAQEAAVAERRFLAEVEHPSIVGVYNFVQHADRKAGQSAGYIVMEYVGGKSLRQILQERRQVGQSLPLPVALAYAIEVLPALGYLHSRGLVYCDFKPDNVIQTEEQLKIIDMGGVRRIDDDDSAIYGTVGYQAPEIATLGPSPSSDLYTVGRALAVMTFDFAGYQGEYATSLPDPASVPLLAQQESFLCALRRATDQDRSRRFASAGEMAEQLTGVLREVLAVADGRPRPAFSTLFSPELQAAGVAGALDDGYPAGALAPPPTAEIAAALPVPQVDPGDPAAGFLATLSTLDAEQRTAALGNAVAGDQGTPQAVARSAETRLALARSRIVTGDLAGARTVLADLAGEDPTDWRIAWYHGLAELAGGNPAGARAAFDAVTGALPGELAAKLALALAAETAGDQAAADRYFRLVWTVDQAYISAVFGLARTRLAAGDPASAIAALATVPGTSTHHLAAQVAAVRIQVSPRPGQAFVSPADLGEAGARVDRLKLDAVRLEYLTAEVLRAALASAQAGGTLPGGSPPGRLLGCEFTERALRFGLERSYRAQARLAPDRRRRIELIDEANSVRPRTWA